MILDTMTYSAMVVIAVLSVVVIRLAWTSQGRQDNENK